MSALISIDQSIETEFGSRVFLSVSIQFFSVFLNATEDASIHILAFSRVVSEDHTVEMYVTRIRTHACTCIDRIVTSSDQL